MSSAIGDELKTVQARLQAIEAQNPMGFGIIRRNAFSAERPRNHSEGGGQRRLEDADRGFPRKRKHSNGRVEDDEDYEEEPLPKRSLESMVSLPKIDTSSRERQIKEMSKTEPKAVASRNRRMFSNLLGTLSQFKKEASTSATMQEKKLKEVEERLAENTLLAKEKAAQDKEAKLQKAKEDEEEWQKLVRRKAILQYADNKIKQYELMKKSIQTKTQPTIFFLPAKHNVRSLELLKNSGQNIDRLIKAREEALERDIASLDKPRKRRSGGEGTAVRSIVAKTTSRKSRSRSRSRSRSFSRSGDERSRSPQSRSGGEEEEAGKGPEEKENDVKEEIELDGGTMEEETEAKEEEVFEGHD